MAVDHVVAPEAEEGLSEAYAWNEDRRFGLGEEFLSSADACIQRICPNPEIYEIVFESYRRAMVRRFPYAVFSEYADKLATVYSVFHTARDPEKWQRRLDSR